MPINSALNPGLYERLVDYYGDVEIVNRGQAISWRTVWRERPGRDGRLPSRVIGYPGEEYKVRCKLCMDHRARLHINHRWGTWDDETQSRNLWLANCFHEQCYTDYDARQRLYEILYETIVAGPQKRIHILPGRPSEPAVLQPIDSPGHVYRLDDLAKKMPKHPALKYLAGRGFDTDMLGRVYGVGWCGHSHFHYACDRIIIPIYAAGVQVGWQARYIGDDVDGVPFNKARVPKYWTSPGFARRLAAYNMDVAVQHSTVVIVEGPTDVWRQGPMCLAALGTTIGPQVRDLIVAGMRKHGRDAFVAVAFDAEPGRQKNPSNRLKPHPTDVLVNELRLPLAEFGGQVVPILLPPKSDPGGMERGVLRELIKEQAATANAIARFVRPR